MRVKGWCEAEPMKTAKAGADLLVRLTDLCAPIVSGGGAAGVSPTFGAALWTMDYVLRAVYTGISRIYFHHGTVGNCQYCFWGR